MKNRTALSPRDLMKFPRSTKTRRHFLFSEARRRPCHMVRSNRVPGHINCEFRAAISRGKSIRVRDVSYYTGDVHINTYYHVYRSESCCSLLECKASGLMT